jgi:predicted phosphodiesterase
VACSSLPPVSKPIVTKAEKFCFIGDIGTGRKDQYLVGRHLLKENCDSIFVPGDIIYEAGISSADDKELHEKFLRPYSDILDSNASWFMAMGNHDYYLRGKSEAWVEVASRMKQINYPGLSYIVKSEHVTFVIIDTETEMDEQVKWFQEIEPTLKGFVVTIGHRPYKSSGDHGDVSKYINVFSRKDFLESVAMGHSHVYIAGHDHQLSDEGTHHGTRQFISGAGAKLRPLKRKPGVWGKSILGYLTMTATNDFMDFEFKGIMDNKAKVLHRARIKK